MAMIFMIGGDYPHISRSDMSDENKVNQHCAKFHSDDQMDEWLRIQDVLHPPELTRQRLIAICREVELDYRHTIQHAEVACYSIARRIGADLDSVPDVRLCELIDA